MWSQVNEIPTKNLGEVFRSLHDVFPCVYVFDSGYGDVNAVAYTDQRKINYAELKKQLENPEINSALKRFKLTTAADIISRILVCPAGVDKLVQDSGANTDDTNHLEFEVARTYESKNYLPENRRWLFNSTGALWDSVDWGEMPPAEKAAEYLKIARARLITDSPNWPKRDLRLYANLWAQESMRICPSADALVLVGEMQVADRDYNAAEKTIAEGRKLYPKESRFPGLAGLCAYRHGDYLNARKFFTEAFVLNPNDYSNRYFLSLCYSPLNFGILEGVYSKPPSIEASRVIELCQPTLADLKFVASRPEILLVTADAYKRLGKLNEAEASGKLFVGVEPNSYIGWRLLAEVYALKQDGMKSSYCWSRSAMAVARIYANLLKQAQVSMEKGREQDALRDLQLLVDMSPSDPRAYEDLQKLSARNSEAAAYLKKQIQEIRF
ncbi:MAG: hypothetical protein K2X27_23295, partial [Candidatus Obscuribacterales bacterium]|nr:hypothetical protein [Candidatus Obscuribacterales bacterium]